MIDEYAPDDSDGAGLLTNVAHIEGLLQALAREGRAVSYSEMLLMLGLRFSRPKMRSLCRTMDEVDRRAAAAGQPELAALVVRESDKLPGQGWWIGRTDYQGEWTGPAARAFVNAIQQRSFDYWSKR